MADAAPGVTENWVEDQLSRGALALYVHWPFCLSKCPYCDFNSHVRGAVDQAQWRDALLRELDHFADETKGRALISIFFGGGTPSLMPPATVAAIIDRAAARWGFTDDMEITLEANPTSVEAEKFSDFQAAGVNRVSIGVQALDDAALKFLGRQHSAREALEAVATAARVFPRYSFDLIYARPGQTPAGWHAELRTALAHAGDHLSVYQLTVEKGTPFYAALRRGEFVPPDEDTRADLYEETQAMLVEAGLQPYEISNHAAVGGESRHNLVYWMGGDYVGIGPGAHGRFADGAGAIATEQIPAPEAWLASVRERGHSTRRREEIAASDRLSELLMMGLRLRTGILGGTFERVTGRTFGDALDPGRVARLVDGGFLELDEDGLRATAAGRQRLDAVLAALIG